MEFVFKLSLVALGAFVVLFIGFTIKEYRQGSGVDSWAPSNSV